MRGGRAGSGALEPGSSWSPRHGRRSGRRTRARAARAPTAGSDSGRPSASGVRMGPATRPSRTPAPAVRTPLSPRASTMPSPSPPPSQQTRPRPAHRHSRRPEDLLPPHPPRGCAGGWPLPASTRGTTMGPARHRSSRRERRSRSRRPRRRRAARRTTMRSSVGHRSCRRRRSRRSRRSCRPRRRCATTSSAPSSRPRARPTSTRASSRARPARRSEALHLRRLDLAAALRVRRRELRLLRARSLRGCCGRGHVQHALAGAGRGRPLRLTTHHGESERHGRRRA